MNSRLPEGVEPLSMTRFRPNFIVTNVSKPWAEDQWQTVVINDFELHCVAACARCKMTTINHETGSFQGNETLDTLQTFRRIISPYSSATDTRPSYGVMFGMHCLHRSVDHSRQPFGESRISVGDTINIIALRDAFEHVPVASKDE